MAILSGPARPLLRQTANGSLMIDVSWRDAEGLQSHLRRRGVGSTLHLDPRSREASLEVWPGPGEAAVRQALGSWTR